MTTNKKQQPKLPRFNFAWIYIVAGAILFYIYAFCFKSLPYISIGLYSRASINLSLMLNKRSEVYFNLAVQ